MGRPSLVCGSAGTGKTLFGIEFIVSGIRDFNEPGVIISFEERTEDLLENVYSLGWDLQKHMDENKLAIDYIYIERSEIEETGAFNLDGLFIRIAEAVRVTGAKRIMIDTLESLFSDFSNEQILRAEIRRLFKWLKDKNLTAVVTAEAGEKALTRSGLEEYLSDFVLRLDSRVVENISTRRLRILKYRGSKHGSDEYPFVITDNGFSVMPLNEIPLDYEVSGERFLTGIEKLDSMMDNLGIFRGSSILISGTAGSGKTSLAATIMDAACKRGEKVLYVSYEESKNQMFRNLSSIGMGIKEWMEKKLFHFENFRVVTYGLEIHLIKMIEDVNRVNPSIIVIDSLSSLTSTNMPAESRSLVLRVLHYIQSKGITFIFTELTHAGSLEISTMEVSSLMDYWIMLCHREIEGSRKKTLNIIKARGMKHSTRVVELLMSDKGIELVDLP